MLPQMKLYITHAVLQREYIAGYPYTDSNGGLLACKNRSVLQADHQSKLYGVKLRATGYVPGASPSLGAVTSPFIINQPLSNGLLPN